MAKMKKAKKRPASKTKKVSAKQSRRRPSVAMLVRRSAKRREAVRDPYDIGPAPEGWSYQWVATLIHGDPKPAEYTRAHMEDNGWRPVWPARYPRMPRNADAEIEVGGQVLMERPTELSEEARSEEIAISRQGAAEHPARPRRYDEPFRLIEPVTDSRETSAEYGDRVKAAKAEYEAAAGAFYISIRIVLTEREMEAAVAVRLSLEEYAERKARMLAQRSMPEESTYPDRLPSALVLFQVRPGVFDIGTLKVHRGE